MSENLYGALKLDNQVCFALYACSREIIKRYTPLLEPIGLTYTQYIAMMVLWEHHTMTVKEMGTCLHLDSGTLTPLLKKMEAKGLLTRNRSRRDERNLIVSVTEEGMALREKAVHVPFEMMHCGNLTMEESRELYRLCYKLLGEEHTDEPTILDQNEAGGGR